jgi:hypothetical protein
MTPESPLDPMTLMLSLADVDKIADQAVSRTFASWNHLEFIAQAARALR